MDAEKKVPPSPTAIGEGGKENGSREATNPHGAGEEVRTPDPELGNARAAQSDASGGTGPELHELKSMPVAKKGGRTVYQSSCSCGRWLMDRSHLGVAVSSHTQHVRYEEGLPIAGSSQPSHNCTGCGAPLGALHALTCSFYAADAHTVRMSQCRCSDLEHCPPAGSSQHADAVARITELLAPVPGDTTEGKLRHLVQRADLVEELHHRAQVAELERINALTELERERRELARLRDECCNLKEQKDNLTRELALEWKGGAR